MDSIIKPNGKKPFDDFRQTNDDLFLCFAFAFGIPTGRPIHRKAIFNYIQTHISPRSESNLQGKLEKSEYWNMNGNAMYSLNAAGGRNLSNNFGTPQKEVTIFPIVSYKTIIEKTPVEVISYPYKKDYEILIDSKKISADMAYQFFKQVGIQLPQRNVSKPREILSWLLKTDYEWGVTNYNRIVNG